MIKKTAWINPKVRRVFEPSINALVFDIETDGFLDVMTKIHCIAISDLNGDSMVFGPNQILTALDRLANADILIGHNIFQFDFPAIKLLHPDWTHDAAVRDTLVLSRLMAPNLKDIDYQNINDGFPTKMIGRHGLEAWGMRLGLLKGDFSKETDWKEFTDEMGDYCLRDVDITRQLYLKFQDFPIEGLDLEQEFSKVLANQERHGFMFSVKKAAKLYGELVERKEKLEAELVQICEPAIIPMKTPQFWEDEETGDRYRVKGDAATAVKPRLVKGPVKTKVIPFNPNSRDQIAKVLIDKHGWKPTLFTPDGKPKVDEAVLSKLPYDECSLLSTYLMLNKRLGQLAEGKEAWLKLEKNGWIYGRVNHNGALSGRCTHSKPNVAQVPSVRSPYGKECRELFTVPCGYKLLGVDASGLELRCLAHYMARWDDGEYAKEILNGDIHTTNQKAAGLSTRDQAKTFIYALCYGAGNTKIGSIIGKGSREGAAIRRRFFHSMPALKNLTEAVKHKAKTHGFVVGLDGRPLPVRSEHSALNLLLQSAGAILMKKATVLLDQIINVGYKEGDVFQVAHIHDEIQIQVKEKVADELGEKAVDCIKRAGNYFKFRCPLDGEYRIGDNWAETH